MIMNYNLLASRLRSWRITNCVSQEKFAEMLHYSTRTVQSWEAGKSLPGYEAIIDIASVMHVSTDYLLGISSSASIKHGQDYG